MCTIPRCLRSGYEPLLQGYDFSYHIKAAPKWSPTQTVCSKVSQNVVSIKLSANIKVPACKCTCKPTCTLKGSSLSSCVRMTETQAHGLILTWMSQRKKGKIDRKAECEMYKTSPDITSIRPSLVHVFSTWRCSMCQKGHRNWIINAKTRARQQDRASL